MFSNRKAVVFVVIMLLLILVAGSIAAFVSVTNKPEPTGSISTEGFSFEIQGTQVIAVNGEERNVIFEADRNGAKVAAAVAPNRIYVLCDDVLYSMDADGRGRYQVMDKCYNPGELSFSVTYADTTELRTLWYYDGYVYFITYGSSSKLCRFATGGRDVFEICKDTVSAFTISKDGILYGYSGADNLGQRELTYELDLNTLT